MKFKYFSLIIFLNIFAFSTHGKTLTQKQVTDIADKISNIYKPIAQKRDARLFIEILWDGPNSEQINLGASQLGTTWFIHIFKGYISLKGMNEDTIALSLCHEVGHHFGGYPFKSSWASTEGQADYYANHICTTLLWKDEHKTNLLAAKSVDTRSKKQCDAVYKSTEAQALCYRKAVAGLKLANIMATAAKEKPISTKDIEIPSVEKITFNEHPLPQCRFETLKRAALCSKEFTPGKIPGKTVATVVPVPSEAKGSNKLWAAKESEKYTCSLSSTEEIFQVGARPSCWFKPYFLQ